MKKTKIGFVSISHPDYLNDIVLEQTALARSCITDAGADICMYEDHVTDHRTALKAGKYLASCDLDGVVLFLASWIECPDLMTVIREIEHLPMCLQAFPMIDFKGKEESTGSYVSFAMSKGSLDRMKYRYTSILSDTQSEATRSCIRDFSVAARTRMLLRRSRIGLVGYTSMSIYTGTFDHVFLRQKIGPEVVHFDSYSLISRAEKSSDDDKRNIVGKLMEKADIHSEVAPESLLKAAGIYLAIREITDISALDAFNIKCQYEFSKEYGMVPCVPLSLAAEDGIVTSCEGDMMNTVSMLILHWLTGETVTYGDIMDNRDDMIKLSTCGFIPFSMGRDKDRTVRNFMPHPGFNGIQCSFALRPEKVTVMRLIEDRCDYHILYFTGDGIETDLRQGYMPALDIRLDGDMNKLLSNLSGQHYAICYGDVTAKIEILADMLGIKAVKV